MVATDSISIGGSNAEHLCIGSFNIINTDKILRVAVNNFRSSTVTFSVEAYVLCTPENMTTIQ